MKRFHIGYSGFPGEIFSLKPQWQDLGWTTAKTYIQALRNALRRNGYTINPTTALQYGQVKFFEIKDCKTT